MGRLVLLAIVSLVPCQLPAGTAAMNEDNAIEPVLAQSSSDPPVTMGRLEIAEDASKILTRSTNFISSAPTFSVVGNSGNEELQADGQLLEFGARFTIAIQRPSRANLRTDTRDGSSATLTLDGETISAFSIIEDVYVYDSARQPGDINESLDTLAAELGVPRQFRYFLSKHLTASLSRVKSGYYVGKSTIAGVPCDHLALRNEQLDAQVWIAQGDEPVPIRIVITHKQLEGQPRVWLQFAEWDFSPELADSAFTFSPPQNSERFRFFTEAFGEESE